MKEVHEANAGNPDNNFGMVVDQYDLAGDYTILYTAGSRTEEATGYTPEFHDSIRTELKRQVQHARKTNNTAFDNLPLFEKYQFFTPGSYFSGHECIPSTVLIFTSQASSWRSLSSLFSAASCSLVSRPWPV